MNTDEPDVPPLDPRVAKGAKLAEMLWWSIAKRILKIAGDTYGWNDQQWQTAQELFLRSGDYRVIPM